MIARFYPSIVRTRQFANGTNRQWLRVLTHSTHTNTHTHTHTHTHTECVYRCVCVVQIYINVTRQQVDHLSVSMCHPSFPCWVSLSLSLYVSVWPVAAVEVSVSSFSHSQSLSVARGVNIRPSLGLYTRARAHTPGQ